MSFVIRKVAPEPQRPLEAMASPPAVVEDQARLLDDAILVVKQQTHLMRKCLETPGKLMDALKCRYVSVYNFNISTAAQAQDAQSVKHDLVLTGLPTL